MNVLFAKNCHNGCVSEVSTWATLGSMGGRITSGFAFARISCWYFWRAVAELNLFIASVDFSDLTRRIKVGQRPRQRNRQNQLELLKSPIMKGNLGFCIIAFPEEVASVP